MALPRSLPYDRIVEPGRAIDLAVDPTPMAFLGDVHGNLPALESVLAEIEAQSVRRLFVTGDLVFEGSEPLKTWIRLQSIGAHLVRGTSDLALATIDPDALRPMDENQLERTRLFRTARRSLGDIILRRLRGLPDRIRIALPDGFEILVCHGSPRDPTEGIGHDLDDDEVRTLLDGTNADVVVCGCTHVPFVRDLDGRKVVNVGSVGDAPEGRRAHFTVITPSRRGCRIEQRAVGY
ncbi:MAG: metallophosphoesterase [Deltaproteobacteria bacterium]|nr:metallophosphoesterase [Deltaproteobacteria bacterium]